MPQPTQTAAEGASWAALETIATLAFLACLAVMFLQVAARYVFGIAVPWTDETARFLFIAAVFTGGALCQRRAAQIRITVLLDILSPRARRIFEKLSDLITAVIALAVVVGCVEMARRAGHQRAATLPITYSWLYGLQGVSLVFLLVAVLRDLVSRPEKPARRQP